MVRVEEIEEDMHPFVLQVLQLFRQLQLVFLFLFYFLHGLLIFIHLRGDELEKVGLPDSGLEVLSIARRISD